MPIVVEKYYTVSELSLLLGFGAEWVRTRIHQGEFGDKCWMHQKDIRVPASAVNAFVEKCLIAVPEAGIAARTAGELVRKIREREHQKLEAA